LIGNLCELAGDADAAVQDTGFAGDRRQAGSYRYPAALKLSANPVGAARHAPLRTRCITAPTSTTLTSANRHKVTSTPIAPKCSNR